MTLTVTRQQYFTAVAQLGDMDTLYQAIPASAESPAWIEFYSAEYVALGGPLSLATQAAFGWTNAQMQALFEAAGAITPVVPPLSGTDRAFTTLVQNIAPSVPGCPQPTILNEIRKMAIRTCERTLFWRYAQPAFALTPGTGEYDYDRPANADVHAVFDVFLNDSPMEKLTLEQALSLYPVWTESSEPRSICQLTPDKYIVRPVPDNDKTYTLRMFYALKPRRNSEGMDNNVLNELEDAITHAVLQQLLVMPNVAWTDRELAAYHARQYIFLVTERRARANLGNVRAPLLMRFPTFA